MNRTGRWFQFLLLTLVVLTPGVISLTVPFNVLLGEDAESTVVTDAELAQLKGLTQLEWLYLNDTKITNAGLQELKGLTQLKFLSVVGTKITEAGVEELHRALPTVRIRRSPVGDQLK